MSRPAEWISFAELEARSPWTSASTLRRMIKGKRISYRQTRKGAPMSFNWITVEAELRNLDTVSRVREIAPFAYDQGDVARIEAKLDAILQALVHNVGIPADCSARNMRRTG